LPILSERKHMFFTLDIIPPKATAQQQKTAVIGGRIRKYDPANVRQAKTDLLSLLMQHAPERPIDGPVTVVIHWIYPYLKTQLKPDGTPKKGVYDEMPCITRPDCDNLMKALFDAMTRAKYWHDDSQVYAVAFFKLRSSKPCIKIEITEE